jgi:hypothetical protein
MKLNIKILYFLLLILFCESSRSEKISIICNGTDPAVKIQVHEIIQSKVDKHDDYIVFKINEDSYKFENQQISRYPNSPFGAIVKISGIKFEYYISTDEFRKGVTPYKGRILFIRPSYLESRATDAFCSIDESNPMK